MRNKLLRFMTIVLLLLVTVAAKANPVDMRQAREVGAKFISANTAMRVAADQDLQWVTTYRTANNDAAFHVFNTPKGFVIVSANDCARPILGYSEEGSFATDNVPPQMEEYLQGFVEQIQYGIDNHVVADEAIAREWELVQATGLLSEERGTTAVQPLLTDTWNQDCYYNNLCPTDSNGPCGHVYVGCTGTSMGQIMHFWGYPSSGSGSVTYTPSGYPQQSVNFGATTYQWSNMPNNLTSSSSSTQINAVATLLWHCGVALQASYGPNGTSAYPSWVPNVMTTYFGYSSDLYGAYKSDYTDAAWLSMVKGCLDMGRPIHYSGWNSSGGGGHSFVCDGYDANNYLHFNWGWSGYYNNYFALGALTPGSNDFSYSNFAVINIHPNCAPGTTYQVTATASPSYGGTVTGSGTYNCGSDCTVTATPAEGYMFCSWTENGVQVSTETTYSFTVMSNRNLVANFSYVGGEACAIVFNLYDSYGDGWNGNALTVSYSTGCTTSEQLTLESGSSGTFTRNVVDGSHIVLGWVAGSWPEECSFSITYADGTMIYQNSNLSSGLSYEFDVNCGGTPPPPVNPIYVSTTPTNRNVILEEFTGRNCGYCTDGHRIANEIMANNPGRVWAINVHGGSFSPTTYPNMNTTDGSAILGGFNVGSFPSGVVNRSTADAQSRSSWSSLTNTQLTQVAECNVGGEVNIDPVTRTATINVEVYYTGNSIATQNYLTVAMLQDSILGSQSDYGDYNPTQWLNGQYVHMHILRDVITDTWGEAISPTTQGTLISRTYTYQIPQTIGSPNGVAVDLNNIYFLAWVSEQYQGTPTRPILTACNLSGDPTPATYYSITATANPANGGAVNGAGSYALGATCTLSASANSGYSFTSWTKNGVTISTNSTYSFTVTGNASYVANFTATVPPSPTLEVIAEYYPDANDPYSPYVKVSWGEPTPPEPIEGDYYDFEGGLPAGWTVIDANGDGYTWIATSAVPSTWSYYESLTLDWYHSGSNAMCSGSYINGVGALVPDEYLIMPQAVLGPGSQLNFWVAATDPNYPADHFGVFVSTTGTNPSDFQSVQEWTLTAKSGPQTGKAPESREGNGLRMGSWCNYTVDLSAYSGLAYIAFRHFNCTDQYIMALDDVTLGTSANSSRSTYNLYRSNCNGSDATMIAENLTGDEYIDYDWSSLTPGNYKYGLCVIDRNGNAGEIQWSATSVATNGTRIDASAFNNTIVNGGNAGEPAMVNYGDGWLYYDDGMYATSIGAGGSTIYWATMFPAYELASFAGNSLTKVAMYESSYNTDEVTVSIYLGGDNAPQTLMSTMNYYPVGGDMFNEVTLNTPVAIDGTQNLWIVFSEFGTYPANACANSGEVYNRWISLDGSTWSDLVDYGLDYMWMIRGFVGEGSGGTYVWSNCITKPVTDGCTLVFNLYDSYGDGWNGNQLVVDYGNGTTEQLTLDGGSSGTFTRMVEDGSHVSLSWISGQWTNECSFTIYYESGVPIYESVSLSNSFTYGFDVDCDGPYNTYDITVAITPDESGRVDGPGTYFEGQRCTLTATPMGEYSFQYWLENGNVVSTSASIMFTVDSDRSFVAQFGLPINITVTATEGGTAEGGGVFNYGENCSLAATAEEGYLFMRWMKDGEIASTLNPYTFTVTEDATYQAVFEAIEDVYVGDGSTVTNQYLPSYSFYNYSLTQQIYTPSEIGAGGLISTLSFFNGGTEKTRAYDIYMVLTDKTTFESANDWIVATMDDRVFHGEVTMIPGYWTTITLDEPFVYDGTSNLALIVDDNTGIWSSGMACRVFNTENAQAIRVYNDYTDYDPSNPESYNGTLLNVKNQILLHVGEDPTVHHWIYNPYQFSDNMNVVGMVAINGEVLESEYIEVGAFCGDQCRGSDFVMKVEDQYLALMTIGGENGDLITFRAYDHLAGREIAGVCEFTAIFETNALIGMPPEDPVVFNFVTGAEVTQTTTFVNGWTWWSTYVDVAAVDVLGQLKDGLGASGQVIKSQTASTMHLGNNWVGSLTLNNENGFMVKATSEVSVDVTGPSVTPENHEITLNPGWTWIGYPSTEAMPVAEALANHTPQPNDVIKGQNASAMYMMGQWRGSLTLTPGMGLMYKSGNTAPVTLTYAIPSRNDIVETEEVEAHWNANYNAYPNNMTVLAVVELNGEELNSTNYELAAFANGECRGSVQMMYVEPLDRYMALLTIAGEEAAELHFGLYDAETGEEYLNADEVLGFEADAIVGNVDAPFVIRFRGTTGVDELSKSLQVYPNPVEANSVFSVGSLTDVDGEVRVEIVNALGAKVSEQTSVRMPASIKAPAAAGVYMLKITVDGKETCCRKLVVR